MKKIFAILLPLMLIAKVTFAWSAPGWLQETTLIAGGTTLPSTCQSKQMFIKTDATSGRQVYVCEGTSWVLQVAGGGSSSGTGVQKGDGSGGFSTAVDGTDYLSPAGVATMTNKTYDTAGTGNVFKIAGTQITAKSGNTGTVATTTGTLTSTHCVSIDASGNLKDDGAACSAGGGGSGDITSVGNVTSGAAFDGTQGSSLTFYNASGNATMTYDGVSINFSKPVTTASSSTPQIDFYPTLTNDTHWILGVNGDGGNDNDDNLIISEGTTLGSSIRWTMAPGGQLTLSTPLLAASGGTGVTSVTDDTILVANGTVWQNKAIGDCQDSAGNHVNYTASTNAFSCGTTSGTATPAGTTKQLQYNNAGSMGGTSSMTFESVSNFGTFQMQSNGRLDLQSAQFRLPYAASGILAATGDTVIDSTNDQLQYRGSATRVIPNKYFKSFTIIAPTAADDYPLMRAPYAMTITNIRSLCLGGTNVVGALDEADGNGLNAVVVDSDITATAGTSASDDGSLSNPTIASGNYINWHTTSVSGTPTSDTVTIEYTVDPT